MEHIVESQVMQQLTKNNILYNHAPAWFQIQTETQLINFTEDMLRWRKDGEQSDVVVMDFTKAFDKVSHSRLLHKLQMYDMYGIDP